MSYLSGYLYIGKEKKMYNKGDNVIYGSKGVCVIEDITTVPFENAPKDKMYYVLF